MIRSVVSVNRRSGATAVRETAAPSSAATPMPPSEMRTSSSLRWERFLSISTSELEI